MYLHVINQTVFLLNRKISDGVMASKCVTVKLQSKDGDVFVVKAEVAKVSRTIATMLEGYSKAVNYYSIF